MTVIKERYECLQTICGVAKEYACHFFTLCSIADEYRYTHGQPFIDIIGARRLLLTKGLMNAEFYIQDDGCKVLSLLTDGKKWTRKDVEKLPPIGDNDYTEAIYFNPRTQFHHYRRRYMDTLEHSVTVEEGYIESYRVYTVHD